MPRTSATGTDDRPARPTAGIRLPGGFSLVEMLLVLTLVAIVGAMLVPLMLPSPARILQGISQEMRMDLREVRRAARASRQARRFWIDTENHRYRADGAGDWRALPESVAVRLTTAERLLESGRSGAIEFYPDGRSSGGRIELFLDQRTAKIDIEWLTGRVRLAGTP